MVAMSLRHTLAARACGALIAAACVMLAVSPRHLDAQVVRGAVTERTSGLPIAGVVVTLERIVGATDTSGTVVASGLSDANGAYALLARQAGRYRLTFKKVGVRVVTTTAFELAAGETHRLDGSLDLVAPTLPIVSVSSTSACDTRGAESARIARITMLWEDARAALTATVISTRDSLVRQLLVRYTRTLDARTRAVLTESLHRYDGFDGLSAPFFRSLGGDSLSQVGYWREEGLATTVYHAPDASVLLSDAFARDHCFGISDSGEDRAGMVGLTFAPVAGRRVPDIRGTLWLDARSNELRELEFTWTPMPHGVPDDGAGGDLFFTSGASGAWHVTRWFLRMPRDRVALQSAGGGLREFQRLGFVEEGGRVLTDSLPADAPPAILQGVLAGRGDVGGARVRLLGTVYATTTDARGRFRFDAVPPGLYQVVADLDRFTPLGVRAAEQGILLDPGSTRDITLRVRDREAIAETLCPGRDPSARRATLRVVLVDSASGAPLPDVALRLRWIQVAPTARDRLVSPEPHVLHLDATTGDEGAALFCGVIPNPSITLGYATGEAGVRALTTLGLTPNEVVGRVIRVAPPR